MQAPIAVDDMLMVHIDRRPVRLLAPSVLTMTSNAARLSLNLCLTRPPHILGLCAQIMGFIIQLRCSDGGRPIN